MSNHQNSQRYLLNSLKVIPKTEIKGKNLIILTEKEVERIIITNMRKS